MLYSLRIISGLFISLGVLGFLVRNVSWVIIILLAVKAFHYLYQSCFIFLLTFSWLVTSSWHFKAFYRFLSELSHTRSWILFTLLGEVTPFCEVMVLNIFFGRAVYLAFNFCVSHVCIWRVPFISLRLGILSLFLNYVFWLIGNCGFFPADLINFKLYFF